MVVGSAVLVYGAPVNAWREVNELCTDGVVIGVGGLVLLAGAVARGAGHWPVLTLLAVVLCVLSVGALRVTRRALTRAAPVPADTPPATRRQRLLRAPAGLLLLLCPLSAGLQWPLVMAGFGLAFAWVGALELARARIVVNFERKRHVRIVRVREDISHSGELFIAER